MEQRAFPPGMFLSDVLILSKWPKYQRRVFSNLSGSSLFDGTQNTLSLKLKYFRKDFHFAHIHLTGSGRIGTKDLMYKVYLQFEMLLQHNGGGEPSQFDSELKRQLSHLFLTRQTISGRC